MIPYLIFKKMLYIKHGFEITIPLCRKSRTTFDTSDTKRAYGPIIIDYTKVQAKVTLKYDSWHKEALGKFGTLLGNEMSTFYAKVSKSRTDLEMQSIG